VHPRERRDPSDQGGAESLQAELRRLLSRRDFLAKAGAGVALGGLGGLLSACSSGTSPSSSAAPIPLPRPNHPVRWPVYSDNRPIASNLEPEKNATLQIYNWVAYINESVVKSFCKKYGCKYSITTFNTMSEAIQKLNTGQFKFDIFFPTIDVIGPLIEAKLMRPLNHSYIPNIVNTWPDYRNPFYDEGWRYSVPYSIYTTGMAWRKDKVSLAPGWDMPWKASKYKGKVAILDDYREGISLALLKRGITNLNTTSTAQIEQAGRDLQELTGLVDIRIDNNDYTEVPDGNTVVHQAWSGDIATAASYLPKGTPIDVVGYWFPRDGRGPVANDLMTVLSSGENPVLSHLFLNYLLDVHNALDNYSYVGYMQPLTAVTPELLIKEGLLPRQLTSTVVLPSDFRAGVEELELPASANLVWEQTWNSFAKGL
jgi:spermidine/putrescine transport system substrate-binding protein